MKVRRGYCACDGSRIEQSIDDLYTGTQVPTVRASRFGCEEAFATDRDFLDSRCDLGVEAVDIDLDLDIRVLVRVDSGQRNREIDFFEAADDLACGGVEQSSSDGGVRRNSGVDVNPAEIEIID